MNNAIVILFSLVWFAVIDGWFELSSFSFRRAVIFPLKILFSLVWFAVIDGWFELSSFSFRRAVIF
ncbi:unnamed protein product, partial [Arabidopsis halleri]